MKHAFVVALLMAIPALAGPVLAPCAVDTAANYIAQGSCSENPFVLKNFAWNGGFGSVPVSADSVDLVPPIGSGQFGLSFQGAGSTNPFSIGEGQTISAELDYTIDPRPPILNGMKVDLNTGGSSNLARPLALGPFSDGSAPFATLTVFVCAGDTLADSCKNGVDLLKIVLDTRTTLVANVDFPTPVNLVDVRMFLDMQGPISIVGGGTTVESTPEPGSLALALSGGGVLLFLAYRRRHGRSKPAI